MSVSGFVSGGSSIVLRCGADGIVWGLRTCKAGSRPAPLPVCSCRLAVSLRLRPGRDLWLCPSQAGVCGFAVPGAVLLLLNARLPCLRVCLLLLPVLFWRFTDVSGRVRCGCGLPLSAFGRGSACVGGGF
jgi:hypothetical protein